MIRLNVRGLSALDRTLKKELYEKLENQGEIASSVAEGAEILLEAAKDNIKSYLFKTGALYDSGKVKKVNQFAVDVIFDIVYASIQEFGGTTHPSVTPKSRRFFWYMWHKTGEDKWKYMAMTKKTKFTVNIPASPYLRPAMDEKREEINRVIAESLIRKMEAV